MKPEEESSRRLLPVWIALSVTLGLLIGAVAGLLAWLGGQAIPSSILVGGVAFGGTVTLAVLIINTLSR